MKMYIRYDEPSAISDLVRKLAIKGINVSAGRMAPETPEDWWIEWGREGDLTPQASQRVFNARSYTSPTATNQQAESFLSLNHLRAFLGDDGTRWPVSVWPKEYMVYLWDTKVVGIQRKVLAGQQQRDLTRNKAIVPSFHWLEHLTVWEQERIIPMATRTLHCLGLDFGKVHLGVNRSSGPVVIGVDTAPTVHKRLAQVYAEAIYSSLIEWQRRESITIGSDPEFMLSLLPSKRMVPASRFFPKDGVVGCDNRRAFGASDDLPLAEVRPNPANTAEEAINQIRVALKEANRLCPYANIAWVAGSEPYPGYPIGGHIHFGGIRANSQLIRALDQYVALPLLFLENQETARRRRQFYGWLGDFRLKPHGFEYRTPGSWLASPDLAWVALTLASLVAKNHQYLKRWDFQRFSIQEAFYSGELEPLVPLFKTCLAELYALNTSEESKKLVSTIWYMYEKGLKSSENIDFRTAWGLPIGVNRYRQVPRPRHTFSWIPGRAIR